jgi:hypothetical protein
VVIQKGSDVLALFADGQSYYYRGTVADAKTVDATKSSAASFLVKWDDGDKPSWVGASRSALASRVPPRSEIPVGALVLALWQGSVTMKDDDSEADVWFEAEVRKAKGRGWGYICGEERGGEG